MTPGNFRKTNIRFIKTLKNTYNLYKVSNTGNSSKNVQADVGMRGQHINVVLTQGVDDDGFAPVNQVSSNLKDLGSEIVLNY